MSNATTDAVRAKLEEIRPDVDRLFRQADDEGIRVQRSTTEGLLDLLELLARMERDAGRNTQLVSKVRTEKDRVREALGMSPPRRRRRR